LRESLNCFAGPGPGPAGLSLLSEFCEFAAQPHFLGPGRPGRSGRRRVHCWPRLWVSTSDASLGLARFTTKLVSHAHYTRLSSFNLLLLLSILPLLLSHTLNLISPRGKEAPPTRQLTACCVDVEPGADSGDAPEHRQVSRLVGPYLSVQITTRELIHLPLDALVPQSPRPFSFELNLDLSLIFILGYSSIPRFNRLSLRAFCRLPPSKSASTPVDRSLESPIHDPLSDISSGDHIIESRQLVKEFLGFD
jgi:hypothetical protein